jgi:nitrite reductase/ring-hydroxylating ferredoxin subunit
VTARPPAGRTLCRLDEIDDPGAKGFRFREGDAEFAGFVVRWRGRVLGYVDSCPHAGWPLALFDRYLTRQGDLILCAGHGAVFRPDDGLCLAGPCAGDRLKPWPVQLAGDAILTA